MNQQNVLLKLEESDINESFYKSILNFYLNEIQFNDINNKVIPLNGPISYYLADDIDDKISITIDDETIKLFEIDIKSAFKTISFNYIKNKEFLSILKSLSNDKKARNIFIAKNLKGQILKKYNVICKLIIIGLIFDITYENELDNIIILELKKDGCTVLSSNDTFERLKSAANNKLTTNKNKFTSFLLKNGFEFNIKEFLKYSRKYKTSHYLLKDNFEIITKGTYKLYPEKLLPIKNELFINPQKNELKEKISDIYNMLSLKIIKVNKLTNLLKEYYFCDDRVILNHQGKYSPFKSIEDINPKEYLKKLIYPII